MEKIIRHGVWHLVTGILCTLLGWGLANFISIDTDGVRVTGLRERVEVWRLTSEIRRLERDNTRLEREVERLRKRKQLALPLEDAK